VTFFPPLYPIIDTGLCRERGLDPVAVALACLKGGARLLQLRHKLAGPDGAADGGSGYFLELATQMAALAQGHGAALIVNDRADIARLAGAAGVHVGQDDMPVEDVRRVAGADAIVGLSTHTEAQVDAALGTSATYVAVGPVFGTTTKMTGYAARGLELVRYASGRGMPIVAIGGVTIGNAAAVLSAGASSVAVISDILQGGDPEARVRAFLVAVRAGPDSGTGSPE
jgi:thiamine-phosphate pyrophosphorylase